MANASAIDAAERAYQHTKARLWPFDAARWFTLGFAAWLDQCGRGGTGSLQIPGGPGGGGSGGGHDGGFPKGDEILAWMASHALLLAGIAAGVMALILIVSAIVAWLQSRGTFLYLDCVGNTTVDLGRGWREHASRASSYFTWIFGVSVLAIMVILFVLVVPIGWSVYSFVKHGFSGAPLAVLIASVLFIFVFALSVGLLNLALRSFVAPLQWSTGLSCGAALRLFGGLLRANVGLFVAYVLLRMAFTVVAGIVVLLAGCVTCFACCCGLLPVVQQTLLQPIFYFERRWSLEILADLGHPVPGMRPEPPAAPSPLEGLVPDLPPEAPA